MSIASDESYLLQLNKEIQTQMKDLSAAKSARDRTGSEFQGVLVTEDLGEGPVSIIFPEKDEESPPPSAFLKPPSVKANTIMVPQNETTK